MLAVLALALLATPAGAEHTVTEAEDEGSVLVGHPLARQLGPSIPLDGSTVGSAATYTFEVDDPGDRVDVEVVYDTGPRVQAGPCTQPTDLDLRVTGRGDVVRRLDGCDEGRLAVSATGLTPGTYTVQVWAEHGATVCTPSTTDPFECPGPTVGFAYSLHVWDPDHEHDA